jgi:hypothetical protein
MEEARQLQNKINSAVEAMVESIDKNKLRKFQRQMHLNIASCYENYSLNSQQTQNCAQKYMNPMENVQNLMQNEMSILSNRLQRCSQGCADEIRDKFSSSDLNSDKAEAAMLACSKICVNKQIDNLKVTQVRLESEIDKIFAMK